MENVSIKPTTLVPITNQLLAEAGFTKLFGKPVMFVEMPDKPKEMYLLPLTNEMAKGFLMDFGKALKYLRANAKVARSGWNGKGMWIALQIPDANSKMTSPYIYMKTVDGNLIPWVANQADVLAEDWAMVP